MKVSCESQQGLVEESRSAVYRNVDQSTIPAAFELKEPPDKGEEIVKERYRDLVRRCESSGYDLSLFCFVSPTACQSRVRVSPPTEGG